ncbi:DUF4157 domain-containing protein [Myxococcus sp. CA056]|uniref:eCIS core domain-containing protein n=1 Tax=Myxococcus sp. CA056 TaxID=2741740 RepID=UPI00157A3B02|nr:DUF4157 domain-containing protein [Myxococcus sp. CA056]NTX10342.1 DUF4157 domain-containing protein [Myxococcus sp. CA056]
MAQAKAKALQTPAPSRPPPAPARSTQNTHDFQPASARSELFLGALAGGGATEQDADALSLSGGGATFDFASIPLFPPSRPPTATGWGIQRKAAVGPEDDPFEREADAIAMEVLGLRGASPGGSEALPSAPSNAPVPPAASVAAAPGIALAATPQAALEGPSNEPDERASGALEWEHGLAPPSTPPADSALPPPPAPPPAGAAPSGGDEAGLTLGGSPMPQRVRRFFEERFGHDLSSVRIHADGESVRRNEALQSYAFTYGSHVWLGAGQRAEPSFILAHELAHVLQQTQPRALGGEGAGGAPQRIQRVPYWEPAHETGTTAHRRLIPAMANASGVFGEAPVPERGTGAGGLGTRGEADFYRASGPGGNNTVAVRFNAHDDPRWLGAPGDLVAPGGYDHAVGSAPQGPRTRGGAITRVDQAPTQITLGEMKPAFGADPEPQLTRYEEAFRAAAGHTNDYANRQPSGTNWNPSINRFAQADLTIPPEYQPGNTSQVSQDLIIKEFDLEKRSVRRYLREQGYVSVPGRLRVRFEGNPGSWVYAWVPDSIPTNPRLPRSIQALGPQIITHLRDPLFQFPIRRRTPGRQPKLRPARLARVLGAPPKALKKKFGKDFGRAIRRRGPPQLDPFRAQYPQWTQALTRYSQQYRQVSRADKQNADAATDLVSAHQRLLRDGWTTTPLSAVELESRNTNSAVKMWTGASARTFGFFRYHFGWLFEKVANAYEWLRDRIQGALSARSTRATGDGLTRAVINAAFQLLKVAGRILVDRTFDQLIQSLVGGVEDKIQEWTGVDTEEAMDALAGRMNEIKDQVQRAAMENLEQLLGESVINGVITVLDQLNEFQTMVADIGRLVSYARWGLRLLECLSPPGWGCLWILAQAVGEALLAEVVASCWFQTKAAPYVTAIPWLGRLPTQLASSVVTFTNAQLPGWLSGILRPITVSTQVAASEVACQPGSGGGGGGGGAGGGRSMPDPALADAMIGLAERVGEERLRAFARMSRRMGIPAGRPLTAEDLRTIGDRIIASGATAADMERFAAQSNPTATGGLLDLATYLLEVRRTDPSAPVDTTQQWGVTASDRERQRREQAARGTGTQPGDATAPNPPGPGGGTTASRPEAPRGGTGPETVPVPQPGAGGAPDTGEDDLVIDARTGPAVVDAATRPYPGRGSGRQVEDARVQVRNGSPDHQLNTEVLLWISGFRPPTEEQIALYNVRARVVVREQQTDRWLLTYELIEGVSLSPEIPSGVLPAGFRISAHPRVATPR